MAGSQIAIPANGSSDWSDFVTFSERIARGYMGVSLTHMDDATIPQIAAGSGLEVGGAFYQFSSLESITGWSGIGNDTFCWIKVVPSGSSITAEFTDSAPTWSTSKQGWYDSNDRYIAQLYRDTAGTGYVRKRMLVPLGTIRQIYHLRHVTAGSGGATGAGWNTRPLTTELVNEIQGASLSSNVITLPAGTYEIEAVQNVGPGSTQTFVSSRFRNTDDSSDAVVGLDLSINGSTAAGVGAHALMAGRFTIAAVKDHELQLYTSIVATFGYGASSYVHADLRIWKIA